MTALERKLVLALQRIAHQAPGDAEAPKIIAARTLEEARINMPPAPLLAGLPV